jgi:hypothetical protein
MARIIGTILVVALTVIGTDFALRSSLLDVLRPEVVEPADEAITTPPVVVSWDGPRPMHATLAGSGLSVDLGLRDSPFFIEAEHFPKPGRYRIDLDSPSLVGLSRANRSFRVQGIAPATPVPAQQAAAGEPKRTEANNLEALLARMRSERDQIESERLALAEQKATLERENRDLSQEIDELRSSQDSSDQRIGEIESQRGALVQESLRAQEENQLLRQQLAELPACTTWGYLSLARNESIPRRIVQVSDGRGDVFRSQIQCAAARSGDPTAISPCACVGAVGQGLP